MDQKYIAAIEIGSAHVRAAAGTVDDSGTLTLLAVEDEYTVDAVRYGLIQNPDEVSNRITKLIKKLENYQSIAPRKIKSVYVGIGGRSLAAATRQVNRHFEEEVEVTPRIVDQINEEARGASLSDRQVLEVVPRSFMIDNFTTNAPIGVIGRDIKADINIINCKPQLRRNIERTISERQQLQIKAIYVRHTALGDLVLTPDERKLGCMLVDFGAETTTVSIYKHDALQYLATLPMGSRNITRDIMTLGHTEERAESIKRTIGDAINVEPNIRRHDFDGDPVEVNNYIRARAGEIAVNIIEQAKIADFTFADDLPAGIVIIGGGTLLRGFTELLQEQSRAKVRVGTLSGTVRVGNPTLQLSNALDVVAVLNKAARNPEECMEIPESFTVIDRDDDDDDDDNSGFMPRNSRKKAKTKSDDTDTDRPRRPSIIDRVMGWGSRMFEEDDDTEE